MNRRLSSLFIPAFVLVLGGCGASPAAEGESDSPSGVAAVGTAPDGRIPDIAAATPLAVTELKHAGGSVFLSEVGDGYVVAEQTNLQVAPSVIQTLKEKHATPLELFVTLTDAEPPQKLVDHHFATHDSTPAKVAGVERFALPKLAPLQAPCPAGQDACVIASSACTLETLAWVYLLSTQNTPLNLVFSFNFGQVSMGQFVAWGRTDLYYSSCSQTNTINYSLMVRQAAQANWFVVPFTAPPKSYFFVTYYGGRDAVQDLEFTILFDNPTKVAGIFGGKAL